MRYRWSEERAYFHIRRSSRQQRVPMRNIAARVLEAAALPDAGLGDGSRNRGTAV
jgi:AmiR/NasT family two-component response regulator